MKETGLTGKRRSTTIAATPDDGKSQRKRRIMFYFYRNCIKQYKNLYIMHAHRHMYDNMCGA